MQVSGEQSEHVRYDVLDLRRFTPLRNDDMRWGAGLNWGMRGEVALYIWVYKAYPQGIVTSWYEVVVGLRRLGVIFGRNYFCIFR